jgi:hypothetical protein
MLLSFWLVSSAMVPWIFLPPSALIEICLLPSFCEVIEKQRILLFPSFPDEAKLVEVVVQVVSQRVIRFPEFQFHLLTEPEDVKI